MVPVHRVRTLLSRFEDQRLGPAWLGREILSVADQLKGDPDSPLRRTLVRFGHRFVALAERSLRDDTADEIRESVDDLHSEILLIKS